MWQDGKQNIRVNIKREYKGTFELVRVIPCLILIFGICLATRKYWYDWGNLNQFWIFYSLSSFKCFSFSSAYIGTALQGSACTKTRCPLSQLSQR